MDPQKPSADVVAPLTTHSCTVSKGSSRSGYAAAGTGCVPKSAVNLPSAESATFVVVHGAPTGAFVTPSSGWSARSRLVPWTCTSARNERICAGQITGASVSRWDPLTSNAIVSAGSGGGSHGRFGGGGVQRPGARPKSTSASQTSLGDEMPSNHGSSWATGLLYHARSDRLRESGASEVYAVSPELSSSWTSQTSIAAPESARSPRSS